MNKIEKIQKYIAAFSGQKFICENKMFNGAKLRAIFGGIDFILQETEPFNEQVINASAIFGGIDIFVPEGVNVKLESISIFGGTENKLPVQEDAKSTLIIKTFCLFGGVDIKPQKHE